MEFIPFILFPIIWVISYKYFSRTKGKIISHLFGFILGFVALFISAAIVMPASTPEQIQKRELAKIEEQKAEEIKKLEKEKQKAIEKKQEQIKDIESDMKISVKKAKTLQLDKLKALSYTFAEAKDIDEKYYEKVYDCIGQRVWQKSDDLPLLTLAGWCFDETKRADYDSERYNYINIATFQPYFSLWDGSYTPLVEYVKTSMNNPNSFEYVSAMQRYIEGVEEPYMEVDFTFRGTNSFGAVVTNKINAKVDAKTKLIYDIKY